MNFWILTIKLLDFVLESTAVLGSSINIAKSFTDLAITFTFEACFAHLRCYQINSTTVIRGATFNEIINISFEFQKLFYLGFELQKYSDSDFGCPIFEFATIATELIPIDLSKTA